MTGVGRQTHYDWLVNDEAYEQRFRVAKEEAADVLEQEAVRRAMVGVDRPVFQGGVQVGVVREYSDALMTLLLRGRRPDVFKERHELGGPNGGPIQVQSDVIFYLPDNGRDSRR